MEYTLKSFQADASQRMLEALSKAGQSFRNGEGKFSVALSATTGAGKTVIAASIIEAMLHGNETITPDKSAVFLWVSDSPSLNAQSRFEIQRATSELDGQLREINPGFSETKLQRGQVYFLSTSNMTRGANMGRSHFKDSDPSTSVIPGLFEVANPDAGELDIWKVIADTIRDEDTTLYLIIDEAHRGMRDSKQERKERQTIIQRLINGDELGQPPAPVVLGISATPERFLDVMKSSRQHTNFPPVEVDPAEVQKSGLLKDNIHVDIPEEDGDYSSVHLKVAVKELEVKTESWRKYCEFEGIEPVIPLMVFQVKDKVTDAEIERYMQVILDAYPVLSVSSFCHVFGSDRRAIKAMGTGINYVAPETIEDNKEIRVVFAKQSITTGWNCPRAEVLLSFRTALDYTHITQLLGRMLRTPLGRRTEGDESLGTVLCVLPHFDKKNVNRVISRIAGTALDSSTEGDDNGTKLRNVLIRPQDVIPAEYPEAQAAWKAFEALPSEIVPNRPMNDFALVLQFADELAFDRFYPNARTEISKKLHLFMDFLADANEEARAEHEEAIRQVHRKRLIYRMGDAVPIGEESRISEADRDILDAAKGNAGRAIYGPLVESYIAYLSKKEIPEDEDALVLAIQRAQIRVSAMSRVDTIVSRLKEEARKITTELSDEYRVLISEATDYRQSVYKQLLSQASEPLETTLSKPTKWVASTYKARMDDRNNILDPVKLDRYDKHLMVAQDGKYPEDFNTWEKFVLETEMNRKNAVCWIRNRRHATQALAIGYKAGESWSILHPDFLFFHEVQGEVKASIIDPHGDYLADALPKLRGLSRFVLQYGMAFHRIEAVAKIDRKNYMMLDLQDSKVRERIETVDTVEELYRAVGRPYKLLA